MRLSRTRGCGTISQWRLANAMEQRAARKQLAAAFVLATFADAIGGMNEKNWHPIIRGRFIARFKRICATWGFHENKTYDCFCPWALGGRFFLEQGNQSAGGSRIQSNFGTESHYVPCRGCDGDQKSDRPRRRRRSSHRALLGRICHYRSGRGSTCKGFGVCRGVCT